jgi:hypothetical protein
MKSHIYAYAVAVALTVTLGHTGAAAAEDSGQGSVDGVTLSQGARTQPACLEADGRLRCYDSENLLLTEHPELAIAPATSSAPDQIASAGAATKVLTPIGALAACTPSVRLYRSSGFGGSVLYLTTRGAILNLSSYGFDNDTSSYAVGGCSASFFSGANAAGSVYPGNTAAGAGAAVMMSGWDNTVSSVYIN